MPFASLWLGPRLPGFARLHPEISLRITASNDNLDVVREQIDVAIRYAANGASPPSQLKIFDYEMFPVCSPTLASALPIKIPADLAKHVLLDFETLRSGRPWYDWQLWLHAKKSAIKPTGWLRFSPLRSRGGSGHRRKRGRDRQVAYLARHLREGVLAAPLGDAGMATIASFYVVVADMAPKNAVESFVTWLRAEAQEDDEHRHKLVRSGRRASKK